MYDVVVPAVVVVSVVVVDSVVVGHDVVVGSIQRKKHSTIHSLLRGDIFALPSCLYWH